VGKVIRIFRHEAVEKLFQIATRGRVGIFHNDDAATGVLNKNGDGSILNARLLDLRLHVISNFGETFATGAQLELVVANVHATTLFGDQLLAKEGAHAAIYVALSQSWLADARKRCDLCALCVKCNGTDTKQ
jgi:hypothetical protein